MRMSASVRKTISIQVMPVTLAWQMYQSLSISNNENTKVNISRTSPNYANAIIPAAENICDVCIHGHFMTQKQQQKHSSLITSLPNRC